MARLAREEVIAADEIAIVHVMNRTVRRCFLFGEDAVSGKNYDHHKICIDQELGHRGKTSGASVIGMVAWCELHLAELRSDHPYREHPEPTKLADFIMP